jgi:hypothetical protein
VLLPVAEKHPMDSVRRLVVVDVVVSVCVPWRRPCNSEYNRFISIFLEGGNQRRAIV